MNYIENESTLRHLRKQHKDWTEEQIKAEAIKIWDKYIEDNKERLKEEAKKRKEDFEQALDREFMNFLMNQSSHK
jgi:hypothetical protein